MKDDVKSGELTPKKKPENNSSLLQPILHRNFSGQQLVELGRLVERVPYGGLIPSGTLVLMPSGGSKLRFSILSRAAPNKGFSEPLALNGLAAQLRISPEYLLWFFSKDFVGSYLAKHARGSVFIRIPREVLHKVQIPVPRSATAAKPHGEVIIVKQEDKFRILIGEMYADYRLNFDHQRYRTAVILAGAISEMIVYRALVDRGVASTLLKRARFDDMLNYLELLGLSAALPLSDLKAIKKKRNEAIHAELLLASDNAFTKCLNHFDAVIKYFGLS